MHKKATSSSCIHGKEAEKVTDENVQTWWRAATANRNEWLCVDLENIYTVNAVQINFADDIIDIPCPALDGDNTQERYIEEKEAATQWKLEGSLDGRDWFLIADKSNVGTDFSHDFVVNEEGIKLRYVRLSNMSVPYNQNPCISGLRVFGRGDGAKPETAMFHVDRKTELDMFVEIAEQKDALGWNILFGAEPGKLYHSYMVFTPGAHRIGALIKNRKYYVRVDAFNENGIMEGNIVKGTVI